MNFKPYSHMHVQHHRRLEPCTSAAVHVRCDSNYKYYPKSSLYIGAHYLRHVRYQHIIQKPPPTQPTQIDPQPLPKLILQKVRYSTSYFNFQYILVSLRLYASFFHRRHRTSVPSIGPSINRCRRHFLTRRDQSR
jgi:hypothetical protein